MKNENNTPAMRRSETLYKEPKNHKIYNIPKTAPKRIVALCHFLNRSMYKLEAFDLYGETCLNTTVSELCNKQGYDFDRKRERHLGRSGKVITYVRYTLKPHCRKQAEKELGEYCDTLEV
ncbi:hypothetical protein EBI01_12455 [Marinomonas rhizomae]|uniref:Uncharacterized protein n=1 Tax=Marinomonas rhizomae TaxID=491948 RepID=A0A366J7Q5_9GAMM|nr:hypothetical protein [Marinomonas rhizomae]RBP83046.1 hypothetical protein DFP80_10712 [Marinomonas rhizomae]RNF72649.1 hypothetical protein EBI01_12455 [Marinomonas rhizomae]